MKTSSRGSFNHKIKSSKIVAKVKNRGVELMIADDDDARKLFAQFCAPVRKFHALNDSKGKINELKSEEILNGDENFESGKI